MPRLIDVDSNSEWLFMPAISHIAKKIVPRSFSLEDCAIQHVANCENFTET